MIICSGTSRLVVIGGESLPEPGEQRNQLLLALMLGKPHGLGGEGSQANKVSVVTADPERDSFHFHFYQIIQQTGQLMDRMECSNAAAAAGLFARLSRVARPKLGATILHTTNTATGQHISLSIPAEKEMWKHPWGVRFNLEAPVTAKVLGCAQPLEMIASDRVIRYHIVPHGNVFVFCQISPDLMTTELSLEIASQASAMAVKLGRAQQPFLPKIIPYALQPALQMGAEAVPVVSAASFFEGERHASMPGSASMALGLFLYLVRRADLVVEDPQEPQFEVLFSDGSMRVRLGVQDEVVTFTEFFTPVKLLLHGAAPVPEGHTFLLEVPEAG